MMERIKILALILSAIICFAVQPTLAQQKQNKNVHTLKISRPCGLYTEKFSVLASDTAVKHGQYSLIYKGKVIETGEYKKGKRVGGWKFYNINNEIEFIYDYDDELPYQIMPHKGYTYTAKTFPSMYLGSPLVPYHFIATHTYYPVKEQGNTRDCTVVLALEISATGKVTGYHLEKESKAEFNRIVLNAAAKIPSTWRFVPAREGGKNVPGIYRIILIFEAVE